MLMIQEKSLNHCSYCSKICFYNIFLGDCSVLTWFNRIISTQGLLTSFFKAFQPHGLYQQVSYDRLID